MHKGRGHMTASILSQTARAHYFLTHETECIVLGYDLSLTTIKRVPYS